MKKSELIKLIKEVKAAVIKEGYATEEGRKWDEVFEALGYDEFHEFIGDNPGASESLVDWITGQREHRQNLLARFEKDELERFGFYDLEE